MKAMLLPIFISLGAIITIAAAWVQWNEERKEKAENAKLSKENKDLLLRLSNTSQETIDNLTGGDNVPIILITIAEDIKDGQQQLVTFKVMNTGKYPFKKVHFEMEDDWKYAIKVNFQKKMEDGGIDMNVPMHQKPAKVEVSKDNIIPNSPPKDIYETKFISELKYIDYYFEVRWENGQYTGKIAFEKPEGSKAYLAYVIDAWGTKGVHLPHVIVYTPTQYR